MKCVELLAPARDVEHGRAAVDYGADALYVGGAAFGARTAAGNSAEQIARLVEYARPFGVRVYAAMNTLLFDGELRQAEKTARELLAAGVDALIVQDMAYRRMGLDTEFHSSTQMCNASPEQVEFLQHAGFARAILERGLSLDEIRAIRTAAPDIEIECFVHGAICVGFSGRCFLSRSTSARSGNRGDCMQACRLPYELFEDGRSLGRGHYLSPLDLDLSARLEVLVEAGVSSLKIEGRLKDMNYIKNVVAYYRQRLDALGVLRPSSGRVSVDFEPDPRRSFSRGSTEWLFTPTVEKRANFLTPKATGAYIGTVTAVEKEQRHSERSEESLRSFAIAQDDACATSPLIPGDGICFVSEGELKGTYINKVAGARVTPDKIDGIAPGTRLFRSRDKAMEDALAASRPRRAIGVEAVLTSDELILKDEDGYSAAVQIPAAEPARDAAKAEQSLRTQLSKSGDTIFDITHIDITCTPPFLPMSAVNALRRDALAQLLAARNVQKPQNKPAEEPHYPFKVAAVAGWSPLNNVTNRLAAAFYKDHGAQPAEPTELRADFKGVSVLHSAYCLRRELGRCTRSGAKVGALTLRRGNAEFRLEFDCKNCRMTIFNG